MTVTTDRRLEARTGQRNWCLTPAEVASLEAVWATGSSKGAADKLFLSWVTIRDHTASARMKLGVSTTLAACREAIRSGLMDV